METTLLIEIADIAWAAGFLDGEGSFEISVTNQPKYNSSYCPILSANQVDPRPIWRLYRLFKGCVYENPRPEQNCHDQHKWKLMGAKKCLPVLEALQPHLSHKDKESRILIKLCKLLIQQGSKRGKRVSETERNDRRMYYIELQVERHREPDLLHSPNHST